MPTLWSLHYHPQDCLPSWSSPVYSSLTTSPLQRLWVTDLVALLHMYHNHCSVVKSLSWYSPCLPFLHLLLPTMILFIAQPSQYLIPPSCSPNRCSISLSHSLIPYTILVKCLFANISSVLNVLDVLSTITSFHTYYSLLLYYVSILLLSNPNHIWDEVLWVGIVPQSQSKY